MVDFKKLLNRTPEEIAAAQAERDRERAKKDKQERDAIEALCNIDRGLNEWEVDFVESVARQFERDEYLTAKQWSIVNRILDKHG